MNFEEWLKEMSKEALFAGDDENLNVVESISPFGYEDSEEEDSKNPKVDLSSRSSAEFLFA